MLRCLEGLLNAASLQHRLILVDDGSDESERLQVERFLEDFPMQVVFIGHSRNRGFKEAVLTGLKHAQSRLLILLNNDTVVSKGFDQKLVEPILEYADVAATGPVSNHPTDLYQYRERFSGCSPEQVDQFQARIDSQNLNEVLTEAPYLTGMCLALDHSVLDHTSLFDAAYQHGYFEDLALCCRMRARGYRLGIREDCLVYHDGHATYKDKTQTEKHEIVMHNLRIFEADWGHMPEHEELLEKMDFAGKVCPL